MLPQIQLVLFPGCWEKKEKICKKYFYFSYSKKA
jgi:hypothetical protein